MSEYLSGEKNLKSPLYNNSDNNNGINLPDVFALIAHIVIEG